MIGVNFQPGAQDAYQSQSNGQARSGGGGVQEAIKILSLRLPRVLGAQAAVPMPLLTSQGSGGNPRVDSVVNQVMQRIMGGQPMGGGPTAPMLPSGGGAMPDFGGMNAPSSPDGPSYTGPGQPPQRPIPETPQVRDVYAKPRFVFKQDPPILQPPGPGPNPPPNPPPGPAWPDPFNQPRERGPFRS